MTKQTTDDRENELRFPLEVKRKHRVSLPFVRISIQPGEARSVDVDAIVDCGSAYTMVDQRLAAQLGFDVDEHKFEIWHPFATELRGAFVTVVLQLVDEGGQAFQWQSNVFVSDKKFGAKIVLGYDDCLNFSIEWPFGEKRGYLHRPPEPIPPRPKPPNPGPPDQPKPETNRSKES